uniref:Uncharacterized protein n=1 Tax=Vitis vinifera TaxID=29760 RepID=A5C6H6_VITVI|nr:hypothetical protein VITISV_042943 [Vitis vinifera]
MMSKSTYTMGPSFQPSFTKLPHTEIPSHQAPHASDHAPWIDLSAHISFLDTHMEELAIVSDTRFYSMEDRMDQYQTDITSQFEYLQLRFKHMDDPMDQHQIVFEHLQQRIESIESHRKSQHEEIMAYLRSEFPPPPPQP